MALCCRIQSQRPRVSVNMIPFDPIRISHEGFRQCKSILYSPHWYRIYCNVLLSCIYYIAEFSEYYQQRDSWIKGLSCTDYKYVNWGVGLPEYFTSEYVLVMGGTNGDIYFDPLWICVSQLGLKAARTKKTTHASPRCCTNHKMLGAVPEPKRNNFHDGHQLSWRLRVKDAVYCISMKF